MEEAVAGGLGSGTVANIASSLLSAEANSGNKSNLSNQNVSSGSNVASGLQTPNINTANVEKAATNDTNSGWAGIAKASSDLLGNS